MQAYWGSNWGPMQVCRGSDERAPLCLHASSTASLLLLDKGLDNAVSEATKHGSKAAARGLHAAHSDCVCNCKIAPAMYPCTHSKILSYKLRFAVACSVQNPPCRNKNLHCCCTNGQSTRCKSQTMLHCLSRAGAQNTILFCIPCLYRNLMIEI